MKITLIGPTYPFRGGIAHYTTLLYKHLRTRHTVHFISFKRQYPKWMYPGKTDIDPSKKHIREDGVERILDSINPFTWMNIAVRIVRSKSDVLILPWWVSFWAPQFFSICFIVKLYSKAKIIFLCHNVIEHESKCIDKLLTRMVFQLGDGFIVHSKEDQKNLTRMLPKANIKKTHHPTYDIFNMNQFNPNKIRHEYGIQGNILLFFGFIREYKGLKLLLEALPLVVEKMSATLLVVGEFWNDKQDYIDIVEKNNLTSNVIFIDNYIPNEEVGDYFSAADLVVQPYKSATGSGITQIAFGFNKPVIATKVGELTEIIDDGKTGYLVPPESPEKLAEAIIRYFQNDRPENFIRHIEKENYKFSWDRMIDAIEEFK